MTVIASAGQGSPAGLPKWFCYNAISACFGACAATVEVSIGPATVVGAPFCNFLRFTTAMLDDGSPFVPQLAACIRPTGNSSTDQLKWCCGTFGGPQHQQKFSLVLDQIVQQRR
jgi:hypothetical protein